MIGFPNVGKSSVINVLCKKKLVGVDARPGKTKNYQTIYLSSDLMLCDCPGLVFPTVASSKSEMICNAVLPIDNIWDWIEPIQYITTLIPKRVLCYLYKLNLETEQQHVTATHLLFAYATNRGYVTGSGQPDLAKASRLILKDFNTGKLLYCHLPDLTILKGEIVKQFNEVPEDFQPEYYKSANEEILNMKKFENN